MLKIPLKGKSVTDLSWTGLLVTLGIVYGDLSEDQTVPKYATHLVYPTQADRQTSIEELILYSMLCNQPKRADVYWFIHTDISDTPYQMTYEVDEILPGKVFHINLHLGYKTEPRVNLYFKHIMSELHKEGRMDLTSRYPSLQKAGVIADFRFVLVDMVQNHDFSFPLFKQ